MNTVREHREILVFAYWNEMTNPIFMGTLRSELTRGKEIFYFEYAKEWLTSDYVQRLDPDLQLYTGLQFL